MGSKRISNYTSKPSSCLIYVCCHGGLLIALNLAINFGRTIFSWVGPVLASKTSPVGPNYVDQTWSGWTDFFPGPIFSLQALVAKCVASYSQRRLRSVLAIYISLQVTLCPSFITNKMERFSFKSGCVVRLENDKTRRQL